MGPWAPALWTEAPGDGFRPPALKPPSAQPVIYGRRIISLDNRSHYHFELESLSLAVIVKAVSFSLMETRACSCHVVLHLWPGRLQHCHIDCTESGRCINFTSTKWYEGVKVRAAQSGDYGG